MTRRMRARSPRTRTGRRIRHLRTRTRKTQTTRQRFKRLVARLARQVNPLVHRDIMHAPVIVFAHQRELEDEEAEDGGDGEDENGDVDYAAGGDGGVGGLARVDVALDGGGRCGCSSDG